MLIHMQTDGTKQCISNESETKCVLVVANDQQWISIEIKQKTLSEFKYMCMNDFKLLLMQLMMKICFLNLHKES